MKIEVWQGDITTLAVDAIVNAANETLLGGGGVDGGPGLGDAMHQAGRAAGGFGDFHAVGARQAHPGATAAAVNADEKFDHVYLRELMPGCPR